MGGQQAFGVLQIFNANWQPVERTNRATSLPAFRRISRRNSGMIDIQRGQCIDFGIETRNFIKASQQISRRRQALMLNNSLSHS